MQSELFGHRGLRHLFVLLICEGLVLLAGAGLVLASWRDAPVSLPAPLARALPWLFYPALVALLVGLWSALSAAAFRLVTARWTALFWRALAPGLALAGLALAAAHAAVLDPTSLHAGRLELAIAAVLFAAAMHLALVAAVARKLRRLRARERAFRDRFARLRERHGDAAVARLALSHDLVAGTLRANPRAAPPALVGLTSKPWHETRGLAWVAALEASFEAIRAEALEVLAGGRGAGRALSGSGAGGGLREHVYPGVGASRWDSFRFVVAGRPIPENCARCPHTARALAQVPRHPQFVEAMFSALGPGGSIAPHRDILNVWLTCHLPLVVPKGGGLRVGGIGREWKEGEVLLFDASYEHEAWNPSGEPRIVLLVDLLHPEVSDAEAEFLEWFQWTEIP